MRLWWRRTTVRRAEIRRNRPDGQPWVLAVLQRPGVAGSLLIATAFCVLCAAILILRDEVLPYREGQILRTSLHSRVDFKYMDSGKMEKEQARARELVLPIYAPTQVWTSLEAELVRLPDKFAGKSLDDVPASLGEMFSVKREGFSTTLDAAAVTILDQAAREPQAAKYRADVRSFVQRIASLIILPDKPVWAEGTRAGDPIKRIMIRQDDGPVDTEVSKVHILPVDDQLLAQIRDTAGKTLKTELQNKLTAYVLNRLGPTHVLDDEATTAARNAAAAGVRKDAGLVSFSANQIIKPEGRIGPQDLVVLRAEHKQFLQAMSGPQWVRLRLGTSGIALIVTAALAAYTALTQPRIIRNHARGGAILALLLATLLLATLAGTSGSGLYFFGTAPTILVAMILAIAYDRRFAVGVGTMHSILVTAALDQGIAFFLVLFAGVLTSALMLDEVRSRSKLIEVGGVTALIMLAAAMIAGANTLDPIEPLDLVIRNGFMAAAAGLGVGFVVLGILPFIEKAFRITTSISLLELADASKDLLRRLAVEAPGTYNHSLQVATLSEAAAEAIGANSLLCRVGSYYHDIGKINKAEYFVENQVDGVNRHFNLTPNVSLLIIIGHVKDGVEMAKEYNLPTALIPFIQQHHGTTLVEYFYQQARERQEGEPDAQSVPEEQYRYPGPKPRTRETAILMIADAAESATRATFDSSTTRFDTLVRELIQKRLLDGQFDECDITMRDLDRIETAMAKTLQGIYHGRIAYPSQQTAGEQPAAAARIA